MFPLPSMSFTFPLLPHPQLSNLLLPKKLFLLSLLASCCNDAACPSSLSPSLSSLSFPICVRERGREKREKKRERQRLSCCCDVDVGTKTGPIFSLPLFFIRWAKVEGVSIAVEKLFRSFISRRLRYQDESSPGANKLKLCTSC